MALNPKVSAAQRKAQLDTANTTLGATATLRIYDGTPPTYADSALSGNTLLATLAMSATPFGAATGTSGNTATITAASITSATAAATGTASFFRILDSAGTPAPHFQGTVGTATSDLVLNSTAIQSGATVSVTALTINIAA